MYSSFINGLREPFEKSLKNGKEFKLLCRDKRTDIYYHVQEYTCFLKRIETNERYSDMNNLTLIFADGKELKTTAYIDITIEENTLVSIIGYISKFNNELQLHCCAGIERAFDNLPSTLPYNSLMNMKATHKISPILALPEAKESKMYTYSSNIVLLENTKFYYIEEELKTITNNNTGEIDINKMLENTQTELIDYPDYQELEETIDKMGEKITSNIQMDYKSYVK